LPFAPVFWVPMAIIFWTLNYSGLSRFSWFHVLFMVVFLSVFLLLSLAIMYMFRGLAYILSRLPRISIPGKRFVSGFFEKLDKQIEEKLNKQEKQRMKEEKRKMEVYFTEILEPIACTGTGEPLKPSLSELPKEKRTLRLLYYATKRRVCRPFAR